MKEVQNNKINMLFYINYVKKLSDGTGVHYGTKGHSVNHHGFLLLQPGSGVVDGYAGGVLFRVAVVSFARLWQHKLPDLPLLS